MQRRQADRRTRSGFHRHVETRDISFAINGGGEMDRLSSFLRPEINEIASYTGHWYM